MKTLKSLKDLTPSPGQMFLQWALQPHYRVKETSHGPVHVRYDVHSRQDAERLLAAVKPETQKALMESAECRGALRYLCPDETRPGHLVPA